MANESAKLLEGQAFFLNYRKWVYLGDERAIQWKYNYLKWRITIKMIQLLVWMGLFYERKRVDKIMFDFENIATCPLWLPRLKGSSFNEQLFRKGLYPNNWRFNMDKIWKSLEGMGRVLLTANFKNRFEEMGNLVNVQKFQERAWICVRFCWVFKK